MTDPQISAVPFTAWEQAVFVLLFILFLGGVWGFIRYILNWVDKRDKVYQEFINANAKSSREFVEKRDTELKEFIRCTENDQASALKEVVDALQAIISRLSRNDILLENIVKTLEKVVRDLTQHERFISNHINSIAELPKEQASERTAVAGTRKRKPKATDPE